jgi:uncharacterized OsmC-like protein
MRAVAEAEEELLRAAGAGRVELMEDTPAVPQPDRASPGRLLLLPAAAAACTESCCCR